MQRLDSGFPFGSRRYRWGTTFEQLVAETAAGGRHRSAHSVIVPCAEALGLAAISVEATAPRSDRPVIQLCYQLAPVAGDALPNPAVFAIPLSGAFGEPRNASQYELPESGDPSGSVRFHAGWDAGDFSVGLSLYGAPRTTEFGPAPGCLWLSWSPVRAAEPYLSERRARARELAAQEPADIAGFRFGLAQLPVFGGSAAEPGDGEALLREANCALYHPELLPTPPAISALVGDRGAAFWRCGDGRLCASTAWDTIVFAAETPVEISWHDIAPAKGGGFSEIAIGGWSVRDLHGSRSIRDAVEHLGAMAGLHVKHLTGYDC
jgi:hypothetical protein